MDSRRFNNFMHIPLERWAADILGMEHNTSNSGPDLYYNHEGNRCCIETKWALVPSVEVTTRYPKAWTVDEDQMAYPKKWGTGYWGLGLYTLDRAVCDVKDSDLDDLGSLVTDIGLWLVRWNWMDMYKPSAVSGKTSRSEWSTQLRYPKFKDRPKTQHTHEVDGGKIHVTSYVPDWYFFPKEEPSDEVPF